MALNPANDAGGPIDAAGFLQKDMVIMFYLRWGDAFVYTTTVHGPSSYFHS